MFSIFDFVSYREYLANWILSQPGEGYGYKGRIASALGVSSSLISQMLNGQKTLTPDQISDLCDYLRLNEIESEYLHLLADFDRAANPRFRAKLSKQIGALQTKSREIGKRVPRNKELTDEQKAVYYSSWLYTGIRNLTAVPHIDQAHKIAEKLHLDLSVVNQVIRFLIENNLCREENGRLTYGPASTHVDRESPHVNRHHQNWRLRSIQEMEARRAEDLFFTSPMSLSKKACEEIRKLLPTVIQNVMQISGPSDSEQTACLNIDWFEY